MTDKRDLLILGGGLVGMTLALAAAKKGLSSHLVDRADPASLTADGSTAAPRRSRPRAGACSAMSGSKKRSNRMAATSLRSPCSTR